MFRRTRLRLLVILVSLVSVALIGVYRFRPLDASVRVEEGPYCDMALSRNHVNLSGWQSDQCHLHQYTKAEVAECLNELSLFRNQKTGRQHQLQFTFVGDSRTRLQFFSFLQMIPDYDWDWWAQRDNAFDRTGTMHFPIFVQSRMLNVAVSYYWAPLFDGWSQELLSRWDKPPYTNTPDYIFFGLTSHHMLTMHGKDVKAFEGNLSQYASTKFKTLSSVGNLIWLNQYPTIDFWGSSGSFNGDVSWLKMFQYDQKSRQLLKDSGAIFWDSNHPMIEEYIRSCSLADHYDRTRFRQCMDYIHTGFVATDRGTHFLYNYLCNRFLAKSQHPAVELEPGTCCT